MNTLFTADLKEIKEVPHHSPSVSIILPFQPKKTLKSELTHSLKMVENKVGKELKQNYPSEIAVLVIAKLRSIISSLNFGTRTKSIAIYVSAELEKIIYMDIPVNEKIIIDESFQIRDLVYNKKQTREYLVLVISGKESKIYLGNGTGLLKKIYEAHNSTIELVNEVSERVANFSDTLPGKNLILEKFLHDVDASLHNILNNYHFPVFVFGPEKLIGHFKSLTRNAFNILDYIHGNYDDTTTRELTNRLAPHLELWEKLKQTNLMRLLEKAANSKKLAIGFRDVWREAANSKGRFLLLERDYMHEAQRESSVPALLKEANNKFTKIKDPVDDIIEKVLESGGDVEFVENGILKDYHHIALVRYY